MKNKSPITSLPPSTVVQPDSVLLFGVKVMALVCVPIVAVLLVPIAKKALGV
jgi:hypothetical protein